MNNLIDQQDDSELQLVSNGMVNKWLQAYMTLMGSMPDRAEEPTPAQLSALHKRVTVHDNAPYVDMSIWVPFERRMSKVQKCRTYHPLGDGSYLVRDLPGLHPPGVVSVLVGSEVCGTHAGDSVPGSAAEL